MFWSIFHQHGSKTKKKCLAYRRKKGRYNKNNTRENTIIENDYHDDNYIILDYNNNSTDSNNVNLISNATNITNVSSVCITNNDDEINVYEDKELQKKTHKISNTIGHRYTVYTLFMKKYHGLYPPSDDLYKFWIGRGGIASKIKRDMGMPRTYSSRRLLPIF